ncbi:probable indole-3-acetic acid-amido synthetase gh3.5 [Phtheirospermum japonicum]|uniref:Probable indole-3-acetic acid-amido synthetase gh3.5 n=1 Tax=Phtheirospermum japonicum TaxID=374723 RepID=A0A830C651_9LAMI|nr:probable indole-3-acetic acid-amido synthetase gh3.5 [Phtheirospermum japonicum]
MEQFELMSMDAGRVQKETLKKILEENCETEYLLKWGLNGKTDTNSYKACVPIVTHKDLEPYIQRIADGEKTSILTRNPIFTISLSSGTTQGKPKYVPFNDALIENTMQMYKTSYAFRNREYPIENGKALQFIYGSKEFKTKGGLRARTAATNVFHDDEFKKTMKAMQTPCCSPDEVIFGENFHQSLYCHLLCGLIFRDEIQVVSSTFAHSIVQAFRAFEHVWQELVRDIREGALSSRITSKPIKSAMARVLTKPDPELADLIHDKCSGLSNWYGLIPEMFPNAKYVYGIMTGSMVHYCNKLRHYAGDLPLVSADYGASEGWIGANVNPELPPEMVTYVVLPNVAYFEFIHLRDGVEVSGEPVGLTEVEVGEEYEVVVTNFAGLYRYRLGDMVKVKGFHNSTPELQYVCRKNLLLNINVDKNTEKDLQLAVEAAAKVLAEEKMEVVDFTSCVDLSTEPGRYVIFWEINGRAKDEILKECCNCLDSSFLDAGYVSSRKVNAIGALELRVLKRGTFHKVMDHYVELGASVSQFKTPRCVGKMNNRVMQILGSNVVKNYFSTAY